MSHILWNNTDHRVMLWNVNNDGSFTVIGGYGPYTEGNDPSNLWSAVGLSVGPDNVMHLIWDNTDHRAMFWNVGQDGSSPCMAGYGPYTDDTPQHLWDAVGVSTGPDNVSPPAVVELGPPGDVLGREQRRTARSTVKAGLRPLHGQQPERAVERGGGLDGSRQRRATCCGTTWTTGRCSGT